MRQLRSVSISQSVGLVAPHIQLHAYCVDLADLQSLEFWLHMRRLGLSSIRMREIQTSCLVRRTISRDGACGQLNASSQRISAEELTELMEQVAECGKDWIGETFYGMGLRLRLSIVVQRVK
jgi:hypothetical protein